MQACPSNTCTVRRLAPVSSMWVAKQWRSRWGWTRFLIPALLATLASTRLMLSRVRRPWPLRAATRKQLGADRACRPPVGAQGSEDTRAEQHMTRPGLAPAHVDEHALAVDVRDLQRRDLADAQAGAVGQHEDGAVLGLLGGVQQADDL